MTDEPDEKNLLSLDDVGRERVIRDVEAQRSTTAEPKLEDELSIKDWVDRIAGYTREAAKLARQPNAQLQYEAWVELAATVVGRAEQVLRFAQQVECEHVWPANLEHHSTCENGCGLMYGEWAE